jgi:hypothetical protein
MIAMGIKLDNQHQVDLQFDTESEQTWPLKRLQRHIEVLWRK